MAAPVVVKIDSREPDMSRIREAALACKNGKVVAFPTETVYGIGGWMGASHLEKRLREIKGRPDTKPFSYHISDWLMLDKLRVQKTPLVRAMTRQFWPGPVTLIVPDLSGQKIGIRFPKSKIASALIQEVGEPLLVTSANLSDRPSPHAAHQVLEQLKDSFDLLLDGGRTEYMIDSTVVDLAGEAPVILRRGAYGTEVERAVRKMQMEKCPRKWILIVCTGNSCRSPMAEGWLRREIEKKGLSSKIEVASCGTGARDGIPCTLEAELVLRNRQVDLGKFRSRGCRPGDLWSADLIVTMDSQHTSALLKMLPSIKDKTIELGVSDPLGMGIQVYEKTLLDIETKIKQHMNRILQLD